MPELVTDERLSYTYREYEQLLQSLLDAGFAFTDFTELEKDQVVLRHDVDISPSAAREMARIESRHDVESTYCFLLTSPAYNLLEVENLNALSEIARLGHDVALHFDTHYYWQENPGIDELQSAVRAECDVIGKVIDEHVNVVSFHRPPDWVLDVDYDGFENTYQPDFFSDVTYLSDSGQKWRSEPPFPDGKPDRLQLLTHPGLWAQEGREMTDIVTTLARTRHQDVDHYFEPLGYADGEHNSKKPNVVTLPRGRH